MGEVFDSSEFREKMKLHMNLRGVTILEMIGQVAYWLALTKNMLGVHDVFHVSMLCKYISYPSHIL